MWVVMLACRPDPSVPGNDSQAQWWSIAIGSRPIGIEGRWIAADGQSASVRRTLFLRVDGSVHRRRSGFDVACEALGEPCTVALWDPTGGTRAVGGVTVPELWPLRVLGSATIVDPTEASAIHTTITRVPHGIQWDTPSGPAMLTVDAAGKPLRLVVGRYSATRVPTRPVDPEPVDPTEVLAIPVARQPRARRAVIGEFLVDDEPVRVDVPTPAEIPTDARTRVRAALTEVADALHAGFVPGDLPADEVFAGGVGDCTEYAVALVFVLQREGFEARTAAGRVYVDRGDQGALVLHAWAEVQIGDRWVPADAALRQFPADASHLPLGRWVADVIAQDTATIALVSLR